MIRHRSALLLVIAAGALTSVDVDAQARGQPVNELRQQASPREDAGKGREQQLADLHVWLGRLAGRFQAITRNLAAETGPTVLGSGSVVPPEPPLLHALHCTPVGSGSGVSCLFEATDRTTGELSLALLFGVDVDRLGIRFLWLDSNGHAREGFGVLKGDTVDLKSACAASSSCVGDMTLRIRAPANTRGVEIRYEVNAKISRKSFQTYPNGWRTELQRQ